MAGPVPTVQGRIFISYRRQETAYPAGWLYDRLADHFGAGQVFKDVDSIQLGDDFVEVITDAVGSCDVLLVLIGVEWLRITDEQGRRRLDDSDDFVRLEIEAALVRKVRVIPILVDGARMPRADELPDTLAGLVRRQSLELSPSRFEFDTSRLLRVLGWTLAEARTEQGETGPKVAGGRKAPYPNAPGGQDLAERSVQAGPEHTASMVSEAPGTPSEDQPSPDQHKPPGRRHRRRSRRAWVLVGAGAGAALILLVVAIVVALPTTRGGIAVNSAPVTSSAGIRLTDLRAVSPAYPPEVGDTITVSYSLTNTGNQTIKLTATFVGARNATDDNKDSNPINEGRVLPPGQTVRAQGQIIADSAGTWRLWPCYQLNGLYCPDEWQEFSVQVK